MNRKRSSQILRQLADRFGPLPDEVKGLLQAVRIRWHAKKAGFEKLILKGSRLIGYFPAKKESSYFEGETFGNILAYVQQSHSRCQLKETGERLVLSVDKVNDINLACDIMQGMLG